ncbi:TIGR04283 family arsenosugar biosynthesis glycosyltransferase [Geobacter benzoatilyticus]|uniref:TIGR04283 family arsenosugar biosynthesis glycosyltransferase n=2 Tax=Geobacter benzoatilyticus TaxID=2815309 RepID=A0ABX7Q034_9BACT|nr:TIGR04283 family arsenosugar biosynthesis glycosyltransferase [Geobacter benzoatilyticus]
MPVAMQSRPVHPEISIVVPTLNEADGLERLFSTLEAQREVTLELVIADGGSTDETVQRARTLAASTPFAAKVIETGRGRGRQMNAGAAAAASDTLLFLHADSFFPDPLALRSALDSLVREIAAGKSGRVAGHFRLRFHRSTTGPSLPYYFYEWKARLHRPGCIHGDQGLLLTRDFFAEAGPFHESCPILEDVRLAGRIAELGEWFLLPAEIVTSARRFEVEGLRERQTLNAIIMNFAALGDDALLAELPRLYATQDRTGRLALGAALARINGMIRGLTRGERRRLWRETGRYVRANAWQIPFFLDVRRNFKRGAPVGQGSMPLLRLHDRIFDRLTDNRLGRGISMMLTRLWFRLSPAREPLTPPSGQDPPRRG